MNIPDLRNDAEATYYAAQHRPLANSMGPLDVDYARQYGARAAVAAGNCRAAAARGDTRALHIHTQALSLVLQMDRPDLFEEKRQPRRKAA